jgi:hypothetical protein
MSKTQTRQDYSRCILFRIGNNEDFHVCDREYLTENLSFSNRIEFAYIMPFDLCLNYVTNYRSENSKTYWDFFEFALMKYHAHNLKQNFYFFIDPSL